MDKKTKYVIIISVILLIIVGIIIFMITNTMKYEQLEITPNGTTIEVPANQTRSGGNLDAIKMWKWNNGALITYNSHEDTNLIPLSGASYNTLNELIKKGEIQNIDGITCYVLNAEDLLEIKIFEFIKVNYKGKVYCISLSNETSHDNILICCNDKDIAVHMAKSVVYKNVYPDTNTDKAQSAIDKTKSTIDQVTDELKDKNIYPNSSNIENAKSSIEKIGGNLKSKVNINI